jgi:ParB/RepB/Spo0J family partition protein
MPEEKKRFALIPVCKIHQSSVLPSRKHAPEIAQSVSTFGIEQPLIVRSILGKAGEYELVDGHARLDGLKPDELVPVDVRSEVKDSDVFAISDRTFHRTDRSAYEKAQFYKQWGSALERGNGDSRGVQAMLAQKTGSSESLISQYGSISSLFEKLDSLAPNEEFNALKSWSVNRLHELSKLVECDNLLEVAREFERRGNVSLKEVQRVVARNSMSKQILSASALLDEDQNEVVQSERGRRLAEEVNSLATETHQMLISLVGEMLVKVDHFSSTEILESLDKVSQTLRRLKKRTETLHQSMNDREQSSSTQSISLEG